MEFLHASIALLASMVLVLAGMVGWLYWQQTRIFQNMNNIVMVIGEMVRPRQEDTSADAEAPVEKAAEPVESVQEPETKEEDDRASVDVVDTAPTGTEALDTDGLESKTKKDLQDILTKRGIPFSKGDGKTALLSLLKATA